jgi:hypothetical protein
MGLSHATKIRMNPLPQIPTDNLYKFQAVAGLTLVLAAVVMVFTVIREQSSRAAAMAGELAVYSARTGTMKRTAQLLNSANARLDSLQRRQFGRYLDSLFVASNGHAAELDRLLRMSEEKSMQERDLILYLLLVGLLGVGYSQVAFTKWHRLHQSFQDRLLAAQVEIAELDVRSRRAQLPPALPALTENLAIHDVTSPPGST